MEKVEHKEQTKNIRYEGLNGLRAFAALGIVIMHVKYNISYTIDGDVLNDVINFFASFVSLFFIISGFSMCCGYYDSIKSGKISLNEFYKKRYRRSLPVFALLVIIEIIYAGFGTTQLIEGFADITLLFGFLPECNINVVGVGWTLGIIFAFYILFPFFVFLLWSKKRAWLTFAISLFYAYACKNYFLQNADFSIHNILYWMCFFVGGGIVFLYKETIIGWIRRRYLIFLGIVTLILVIRFMELPIAGYDFQTLYHLIGDTISLLIAISCKSIIKGILANRFTKFIGGISLEIYLAHMFVFRLVDKLHLTHLSDNNYLSYIITCFITISGVIVFALVVKKIFTYIGQYKVVIDSRRIRLDKTKNKVA